MVYVAWRWTIAIFVTSSGLAGGRGNSWGRSRRPSVVNFAKRTLSDLVALCDLGLLPALFHIVGEACIEQGAGAGFGVGVFCGDLEWFFATCGEIGVAEDVGQHVLAAALGPV